MSTNERIQADVGGYYSAKVIEHGATPPGADWNSAESQHLRFRTLLGVCGTARTGSLLDYGCGYGALYDYLRECDLAVDYTGFDISEAMLQQAQQRLPGEVARFASDPERLLPADYVVASGLFNVRLHHSADDWRAYIVRTLEHIDALARKGFAFNMLTAYSDPPKMRDDLYYADPCFFFDLAKRRFARDVALLHDYGLYEFTVIVRKAP